MMKPLGSLAALVAAIDDDAAAEVDAITADADATVARLAGEAWSPPAGDADRRALEAARDRARIRIAHEDWHDAREALAEREDWMQRAVTRGRERLNEPQVAAERQATLAALAREAISRLPAGGIEIVVAEADAPILGGEWRALVSPSGDAASITIVPGAIAGGCIARSRDGRASFDNSYAARAERLEATWRGALADCYERVTSATTGSQATERS